MNERKIYPNLGKGTAPWKLVYLKENAAAMSARQIMEVTGMSESLIYDYCKLHGIPLKKVLKKGYVHIPAPDRMVPKPERKEVKLKRPPAKYDNPSHEEVIEKWMNMEI